MNKLKIAVAIMALAGGLAACKKNNDTIIVVPPSDGTQLQLKGLIANEAGSSAGNSVYVDLSTATQVVAARNSWDLGFYTGSDFRVILNNTTSATAKMINKNDLAQVGTADTVGLNKLAIGYDAASLALIDDIRGNLSKTVIAAVSETATDNKVYIVNCGTGGSVAARSFYKIRVLRKGTGYTLQYAKLEETTFKTIDVTKDSQYDFSYVSFDNGLVKVAPEKGNWDFVWGYTMFETALGATMIPYASSDFITINSRNGVQVSEVLTSTVSYADFKDSMLTKITFSAAIDSLGTRWRTASATAGQSGVKKDRFYVIKDAAGNYYKLKFMSFHGDDGGTRGKPELEYKLVKKG